MSNARQLLGRWGESQAVNYLSSNGYRIIDRNVRTPYGELDIIAQQGEATVFIEVKTRTSTTFGFPEESVDSRKLARIIASAQSYIQEHPKYEDNWRVDVIAIQRKHPKRKPQITHFENAIS